MKMPFRILACACLVSLSGCGNWDAVHMDHDFSNNNSVTLDIKTRSIISSTAEVQTKYVTPDGTTIKEEKKLINRICAEPSPDAMTAYAAQLAAKKDIAEKASLNLAGSYQGSAAFVGMRTQTIQLLRDQLYRLCEANMNGWVNKEHYEMLLTRNQRYTLALMAIENLAQTTQVPVVALTSSSTAELEENWQKSQDALKQATDEKKFIEALAEDKRDKPRLAELNELIPLLEERVKNTKLAIASGSTSQHVGSVTTSSNPASSDAINAIKEITNNLLSYGDDPYLCFNFAKEVASGKIPRPTTGAEKALYDYCGKLFSQQPDSGKVIKGGNGPATTASSATQDRRMSPAELRRSTGLFHQHSGR